MTTERRFWFNFDYEDARVSSNAMMVTGWCFGKTKAEATEKARQEAVEKYPGRPLLKTARIHLYADN